MRMTGHQPQNGDPAPLNPPSGCSSGRASEAIPEFHIARLDLRPGDVLVVKSRRPLSVQDCERIRQILKQEAVGHRVMVLDDGLDLAVLTAAEIVERAG